MSFFKIFLSILIGVVALSSRADAACGVCSTASYAACINATAFKLCTDGLTPSDEVKVCKTGTNCYDVQGICKSPDFDASASLGCADTSVNCNQCSGKFACISQTEFEFCDTAGAKTGITGSCADGSVCNTKQFADTSKICALKCLVDPTCTNTEVVTEAPPVLDWKESCAGTEGYHKNIHDATCTQYVYCEKSGTEMVAILYTCPTAKPYFNKDTTLCQVAKPTTC